MFYEEGGDFETVENKYVFQEYRTLGNCRAANDDYFGKQHVKIIY